ncbi:MAG: DNA primase [Persephonella sp.]|nr:MAG: DNA primase [Persephonella sp.]
MGISPETIEEVLKTANVYDVISDYLNLKKTGVNYSALCPFHTEKTPSFIVSPSKNIWKCFGCGKAGNSVKFLMEYKGLSYTEAIKELANKYGIPIKYVGNIEEDKEKTGLYAVIEKVKEFYIDNLKKSKEARKYLNERGVLSKTISTFLLGYSPKDIKELLKFAERENIKLEDLEKIGVITRSIDGSIKDRFRGRIIFPIRDHSGRLVAFGGRILPSENKNLPKYLNSPETKIYNKSKVLYGFYEAKDYLREKKTAIIVEGYFDLLSMYQIGFKNIVATLGTSLTLEHGKLLKKFIDKAILMFDNDKAGKEAVIRASKILLLYDIEVYYCPLADKDPDELARRGIKEVKKHLENSTDIFDFLLANFKRKTDIKERQKILKLYLELVSYIPDRAKVGLLIDKLSKETGIGKEYLKVNSQNLKEKIENKKEGGRIHEKLSYNEIIVLKALIEHRDYLLKKFDKYDKIKVSEYFEALLNSIINNQIEEDVIKEIKSYDVPSDPDTAINILESMYYKWLKNELELELAYNRDNLKNSDKEAENKILEKLINLRLIINKFYKGGVVNDT